MTQQTTKKPIVVGDLSVGKLVSIKALPDSNVFEIKTVIRPLTPVDFINFRLDLSLRGSKRMSSQFEFDF